MRHLIDLEDQTNINERKEIQYQEDINKEKKEFSSNLFCELSRLRNIDQKLQNKID